MHVLGLSGHYRSGKDTVAEMIMEEMAAYGAPVTAKIFRFSGPLKEMAAKYFKWDGNKESDVTTYLTEELGGAPVTRLGGRTLLQGLGHFARSEFSSTFWIDQLKKSIYDWGNEPNNKRYSDANKIAIITDTRYINEAELFSHYFTSCTLAYIDRPGNAGDSHPSEAEMDTEAFQRHVRYRIDNNGTREELKRHASGLFNHILSRLL